MLSMIISTFKCKIFEMVWQVFGCFNMSMIIFFIHPNIKYESLQNYEASLQVKQDDDRYNLQILLRSVPGVRFDTSPLLDISIWYWAEYRYSYVDDKKGVNTEECGISASSPWLALHMRQWKIHVFNGTKSQIMIYGKDETLKNETIYSTENSSHIIKRFETLRDLGVIITYEATFEAQLNMLWKKGDKSRA